ncbi:hypothetical protein [Clostridium isatidis]|uniref:Gram-positive cocci surface proteins LPxTG domain-containing protein n=1 Tax=Clostridium isatidis TaxID=182773 RepID=A0A343JA55_9CLOT|nr:hypothetical protein [Clostridium isatidis]ASW42413.1 hypothetical protein BEN51_02615 [Clostridium isatidis]
MKKFKRLITSLLAYLMVMSLIPGNVLETVVNAAENKYNPLFKSDYYLRGKQQYGDKLLIAYKEVESSKYFISIVENGKETVLKEVSDVNYVNISKQNDSTAIIKYKKYVNDNLVEEYEKYDLDKNSFAEATENDWFEPVDYNYDLEPKSIYEEVEVKELIDKVLKANNVDISIENMENLYPGNYFKTYRDDTNEVYAKMTRFPKKGNIIEFEIRYGEIGASYNVLKGVIGKDFVYTAKDYYNNFAYDKANNTVTIFEQIEENFESGIYTFKLTELKNGKVINEATMERAGNFIYETFKNGDKLYISSVMTLEIYHLSNRIYKLENNIKFPSYTQLINEFDDSYWFIESKDGKNYLKKIKDNIITNVIEIQEDLHDSSANTIFVYNENNILIERHHDFMILQRENGSIPSQPELPNNQEEPTKPEEGNKPGNGENKNGSDIIVKPSTDKVIAEVLKLNPNGKNDINIKNENAAKSVELIVKDIEALKNGTSSLNISINDNIKMNLPLSIIDKSLLEGAKDVTIKLDVLEASDILKDIKGVNKVFDFNLIINKEDGSIFVHNFKEGEVEISISLSDKDLEGLNRNNILVYYYNEETNSFEAMETVVSGNKITFKTSHFSKYVIAEKIDKNGEKSTSVDGNSDKEQLPYTGSIISSTTMLIIAMGMVVSGRVMCLKKRRNA